MECERHRWVSGTEVATLIEHRDMLDHDVGTGHTEKEIHDNPVVQGGSHQVETICERKRKRALEMKTLKISHRIE